MQLTEQNIEDLKNLCTIISEEDLLDTPSINIRNEYGGWDDKLKIESAWRALKIFK